MLPTLVLMGADDHSSPGALKPQIIIIIIIIIIILWFCKKFNVNFELHIGMIIVSKNIFL